jgi:hypothetical protein
VAQEGAHEGRPRARKKTDLQGKLKLLQGLQHGVEQQIHRRNLTYVHLTITRISSLSALHYERGTWQNSIHLTGTGSVPPSRSARKKKGAKRQASVPGRMAIPALLGRKAMACRAPWVGARQYRPRSF